MTPDQVAELLAIGHSIAKSLGVIATVIGVVGALRLIFKS